MSTATKKEIAKLAKMRVNELQAMFAEVTGEKTRCPNRVFLIRRITESLQAAETENEQHEEASADAGTANAGEKLSKLELPELQARYLEVIGRSTSSSNRAYLIWKLREAQKGRVPIGPRRSNRREGVTFKVLPFRLESDVVEKLDSAWKRQGLRSRMDLFRQSLRDFLTRTGENDVAALLTAEA